MQLKRYTDYGLRVLIYLAAASGEPATVATMARAFGVSAHHLRKVVQALARGGFVQTVRGRGGGVRLARAPADIALGAVVRELEGSREVIDCHRPRCPLLPGCRLRRALADAARAFVEELDGWTLADLLAAPVPIRRQLGLRAG